MNVRLGISMGGIGRDCYIYMTRFLIKSSFYVGHYVPLQNFQFYFGTSSYIYNNSRFKDKADNIEFVNASCHLFWLMLVSIVGFLKCSSSAPIDTYGSYCYLTLPPWLCLSVLILWSVLGSAIHQFLLLDFPEPV